MLIVEDEQRVARLISTILGRASHATTIAASLGEARELLERAVFDVVIVDFILPDGDGLAFVAAQRDATGTAAIVMSGLLDLPDGRGIATLAKPFTPDQLEHALERAVQRGRLVGSAEKPSS